MRYQPDDVSDVDVINNPKLTYEHFPINGQNYDDHNTYNCNKGHQGAVPRILPYVSSYTANTAKVTITGIIVFVCPTCGLPVHNTSEQKTSYYAQQWDTK